MNILKFTFVYKFATLCESPRWSFSHMHIFNVFFLLDAFSTEAINDRGRHVKYKPAVAILRSV